MNKQIIINDQEIDYTLKISKRSKRLRMSVHPDGSLVITKPYGLPSMFVNSFLRDKAGWILIKIEYFKQFKGTKSIKNSKVDYQKYKEEARNFIETKTRDINKHYNYNYNRISIRNQTTRWGSCSQNGNLNFNYKLLFLPVHIAEYVITHEICHLKEMNHSYRFWNLVSQTISNYKELRKELKKKGLYFY
ncbi:MAG: M48 family metallopeptidase [Candidatus Kerfeldbacteria bacterium]|jgi:predicted metal-dependent hydrolase